MACGSTGQGRHQGCACRDAQPQPCACPCCAVFHAIVFQHACKDSDSFLPPAPASMEKVLQFCSSSFISRLQAHIPSQEIRGSKYIPSFKAKLDALRSTGKDCVCRLPEAAGKEENMLSALQDLPLLDKPSASGFGFYLGVPQEGLRYGLLCHSQVSPEPLSSLMD